MRQVVKMNDLTRVCVASEGQFPLSAGIQFYQVEDGQVSRSPQKLST